MCYAKVVFLFPGTESSEDLSYHTNGVGAPLKYVNAKTLAKYEAEKAALEKSISGIKKYTDEWYDAKDRIQEVADAISDCMVETYELNNAIGQLHFDLFDDISEGIKRIITEQEFLQSLFAHEKNTDTGTGNFTAAGLSKLGSLSTSYYASVENAERDAAEVKELQRMFDSGSLHSDLLGVTFNSLDDLKAKLDETYTKWQDDIKETYSLETEIAKLMKEKYQAELDLLQELIDAKKEALNAEKDLHDYQKSITEKTDSITTIQKQIAAYSGDASQEGLAKLQKLQKEIAEKNGYTQETEGLFDYTFNGLDKGVRSAVSDIEEEKTSMSGTQAEVNKSGTGAPSIKKQTQETDEKALRKLSFLHTQWSSQV